jgi:hypothetical protein
LFGRHGAGKKRAGGSNSSRPESAGITPTGLHAAVYVTVCLTGYHTDTRPASSRRSRGTGRVEKPPLWAARIPGLSQFPVDGLRQRGDSGSPKGVILSPKAGSWQRAGNRSGNRGYVQVISHRVPGRTRDGESGGENKTTQYGTHPQALNQQWPSQHNTHPSVMMRGKPHCAPGTPLA